MTTLFGFVKRHYAVIVAAGGAILVVMGVLIVTGELTQLNVEAQKLLDGARARLPLRHLSSACELQAQRGGEALFALLALLRPLLVALALRERAHEEVRRARRP